MRVSAIIKKALRANNGRGRKQDAVGDSGEIYQLCMRGVLVRPERFELPTYCSGGNRSIQLSYGRAFR